MHDVDNTSDHEPIFLQLDLDVEFVTLAGRLRTPRTSWVKSKDGDLQQYRLHLSNYLHAIPLPVEALLCRDVTCCNAEHVRAINAYTNDMTAACISAAEFTIPQVCSRQQSRRIPGWSEYVLPFRQKSLFWHMWLDCGRPKSGVVAECMRRSRIAYNYAIRKVRKDFTLFKINMTKGAQRHLHAT